MRRALALGCAWFALSACVEAALPPQSRLDRLRVLAIRSQPPTAEAGATVEVDALVVDPMGDRPLQRRWAMCADPPGDDPARCTETEGVVSLGEDESVRIEAPGTGADVKLLGVILFVCAGGTIQGDRGAFECVGNGAEGLLATRRIAVEERALALNPSIGAVLVDGGHLDEETPRQTGRCPDPSRCIASAVSLRISAEAPEEELLTSWGVTAGELSSSFGSGLEPEVEWTRPPDPGLVLMTFVVRDDRGGVDWETRQFLVQ